MITAFEIIDKIFEALPIEPIKYKITAPTKNLPSEYTVINSLTLQGKQMQRGVLNVNIHVKNLPQPDNSQPNMDRLRELAKIYTQALDQVFVNNKRISINDSGGIFRESDYHFLNIKINYEQFNRMYGDFYLLDELDKNILDENNVRLIGKF